MLGAVLRVLSAGTHLLVGRHRARTAVAQACSRSNAVRGEEERLDNVKRRLATSSSMQPDAGKMTSQRTTDAGASTTAAEAAEAAEPPLGHVVNLSANQEDVPDKVIAEAVSVLRQGGVIGVPTDTIYGLACLAQSTAGVRRIYGIKGRDERKPIAICVHDVAAIGQYAEETVPQALLRRLLPGPVTVVLPRKPALNPELNPHTSLIGVRVPDFPFVRKLVEALGEPLALTSANRSGEQSCIRCTEFQHLWSELNTVYDAGAIESSGSSRLGSTVVDVSRGTTYRVIRAGSAEEQTLAVLHKHGLVAQKQEQQAGATQVRDGDDTKAAQSDKQGAGGPQTWEKSEKRAADDKAANDMATRDTDNDKGEPSPKKSKEDTS